MLDLTKPLQTRDGRPVTLITTQGREPWPLVGYIGGNTSPWTWRSDGTIGKWETDYDLINVPEPKRNGEVWVNIYVSDGGSILSVSWVSRQDADKNAHPARIACVRVPWTEGEGLEGK